MRRLTVHSILILAVLVAPLTCRAAGEKYKQLTSLYLDEKGGGLKNPEGVACNDKGTLIVADTANGRLLRYSYADGGVKGGTEMKPSQLAYPIRLQLAPAGDIYALDERLHRIVHLNAEGAFVGYLEPQGVPAPATLSLRSFRIDASGSLYLLDLFGERVVVLDAAGKFVRQLSLPADHGFFSDLAVTGGGDILLLDSVRAEVTVARKDAAAFTPLTKNLREYVNFPTYLTVDGRGGIYLVDQDGGAIVTLGPDGSYTGRIATLGWKEGQLYYPSQVSFCGSAILAVADRNNSRIQLFEAQK
ncbi:MAG TPA: NHL repeat-containing protein [Geobacteraceae bacterium]